MSKLNARLSTVRPAFLALALILALIATLSPAFAACTSGATRTIILDPTCCKPIAQGAYATKQNQICNSNGIWLNSGSSYCGKVSSCAF